MKKIVILLVFFSFSQIICSGQTHIQIKYNGKQTFDSLKLKTCDKDINFQTVYGWKFQKEIVINDKKPLESGVYWIFGDSTMCGAFLISSVKGQPFSALRGRRRTIPTRSTGRP